MVQISRQREIFEKNQTQIFWVKYSKQILSNQIQTNCLKNDDQLACLLLEARFYSFDPTHHPILVNNQYVSLQSHFKMIIYAFRFEINRLFIVLHDVACGRDGKKKFILGLWNTLISSFVLVQLNELSHPYVDCERIPCAHHVPATHTSNPSPL